MKYAIVFCSMALASAALGQELDGAAIAKTLGGQSLSGTTDQGVPYTTHYSQNGAVKGVSGFDGEYSDQGRWSVEGALYCIQYNTWLGGEKFCSKVVQEGNVLAFTETKSGITTYAVLDWVLTQ